MDNAEYFIEERKDIFIAAPREAVWQILTDINRWSQWHQEVSSAVIAVEPAAGAAFQWKRSSKKYQASIVTFEPPQKFVWEQNSSWGADQYIWTINDFHNGSLVMVESRTQGFWSSLFAQHTKRNLKKILIDWTSQLKLECEADISEDEVPL
jgi:uncharacterized protein YndB with AHSA1/START domain